MANNEIKQLIKEKERKIKSMNIAEIKAYIERNIAYYYSHYANTNKINCIKQDNLEKHKSEAKEFQETFLNNVDLMIDTIKNNSNDSHITKQMKINYVLCILYSAMNDNLVLNHEQESDRLLELYNATLENINEQTAIYGSMMTLSSFVNRAYALLNHVKKMLILLYTFAGNDNIDKQEFNYINEYFKGLFLEFYVCYLGSKNINKLMLKEYKILTDDIDSVIDSENIKMHYNNIADQLSSIDAWINDMILPGNLFIYPKEIFKRQSMKCNNDICYSLKLFNIYIPADNDGKDDNIDNSAVSDEYKLLLDMEKQYNISVLS